jgi:hypothetical protein
MTIEELMQWNEQLADEITGSALYYGNNTAEDFRKIILKIINQSTQRGYSLAKIESFTEERCWCLSAEFEDHPYNPNKKVGEICEVCGNLVESEWYL